MFRQTDKELNENKAKVDGLILPAVLGSKAWNEIAAPMAKWLLKNCVTGGLVDGSPENLIRAITALDRAGQIDWEVAPVKVPEKKDKRFDYAQQSNDGPQRPNYAKQEKQAEVVRLAANDVNSPVFQQKNREAQGRFDELVSRGGISYRRGRVDRGLTQARKEILQKIRVVARQRDSEGAEVLLFEKMVEQAEAQIRRFESEDARREMS